MDFSWPKTDYIKGAPTGHEKERRWNIENEIGAWEIKDRRGKLRRGTAIVISTPSNDYTFVTMMKRE
jgi:hypothetical protein